MQHDRNTSHVYAWFNLETRSHHGATRACSNKAADDLGMAHGAADHKAMMSYQAQAGPLGRTEDRNLTGTSTTTASPSLQRGTSPDERWLEEVTWGRSRSDLGSAVEDTRWPLSRHLRARRHGVEDTRRTSMAATAHQQLLDSLRAARGGRLDVRQELGSGRGARRGAAARGREHTPTESIHSCLLLPWHAARWKQARWWTHHASLHRRLGRLVCSGCYCCFRLGLCLRPVLRSCSQSLPDVGQPSRSADHLVCNCGNMQLCWLGAIEANCTDLRLADAAGAVGHLQANWHRHRHSRNVH